MREYSARMEHMMYTPVTLPVTNEYGYFEIRLESIGGLGANLCGKMLGELGALYLSLNSLSFSSYGSEKRGSPVKSAGVPLPIHCASTARYYNRMYLAFFTKG